MKRAGMIVAGVALGLLPARVGAQERKRIAVPAEVIQQIFSDSTEYMIPRDRDSLAANLVAEAMDLNGDGIPELYVHGMHSVCGASNCLAWIYRRTGPGYERLLDAGGIQDVEVRSAVSRGYRDVVTSQHGSAWDSELRRYKFDGRRYRPVECLLQTYHYLDARGRSHELTRPRITRVRCGPEE
jgi:hypothetical protein